MPDENLLVVQPEVLERVVKDVRGQAVLELVPQRTYVIVLVIHSDPARNVLTRIPCQQGCPVSGYVYDWWTESYFVECVEFLPLGFVPVSLQMRMPGVGHWVGSIPLPEMALRRLFSPQQKRDLKDLKALFKGSRHAFQFFQILDVN